VKPPPRISVVPQGDATTTSVSNSTSVVADATPRNLIEVLKGLVERPVSPSLHRRARASNVAPGLAASQLVSRAFIRIVPAQALWPLAGVSHVMGKLAAPVLATMCVVERTVASPTGSAICRSIVVPWKERVGRTDARDRRRAELRRGGVASERAAAGDSAIPGRRRLAHRLLAGRAELAREEAVPAARENDRLPTGR
jgi:hypothetical protein